MGGGWGMGNGRGGHVCGVGVVLVEVATARLKHAALTAFPIFSRLSRRLRGSSTLAHSCIRNAHPKHKHIPEAKAHSQNLSEQWSYHESMPSSMSRFPTGLNLGVLFHNHKLSLESVQISVVETTVFD